MKTLVGVKQSKRPCVSYVFVRLPPQMKMLGKGFLQRVICALFASRRRSRTLKSCERRRLEAGKMYEFRGLCNGSDKSFKVLSSSAS